MNITMINRSNLITILLLVTTLINLKGQKIYHNTSTEFIFSQSQVEFSSKFLQQYPNAELAKNNVRFTCFIHISEYWHYDINNVLGFFTGLGLRNVGMITDENLPETVTLTNQSVQYVHYKIVHRLYTLGVPLAIKLGSFKDHLFFFAGGEYEFALQYKEKYWKDTWDRSGPKTKSTTWFGNQTPAFIPSVFGGVQLPGGINIKFKYYLQDFLNNKFTISKNNQEGASFDLSDLSRYSKTQLFYLSLSLQFNTAYLTKKQWQTDQIASK